MVVCKWIFLIRYAEGTYDTSTSLSVVGGNGRYGLSGEIGDGGFAGHCEQRFARSIQTKFVCI